MMGKFENIKNSVKKAGGAIKNSVSKDVELWSKSTPSKPRRVNDMTTLGKAGTKVKRIELENLEKLYYMEPLVFAGITFYESQITGGGYDLVDSDSIEAINKTQEYLDDIFFDQVSVDLVHDLCMYGNAFLHTPQVDENIAKVINPKIVEFIKDREGNPILDMYGTPVGIVAKTDKTTRADQIKEIIENEGIDLDTVNIKNIQGHPIPKDEIAHFRLNKLSDTQMGVGMIEPVYHTVILKLYVEEALGNCMKNIGFPTYIGYLGDDDVHDPSQNELQTFNDEVLSDIEESESIAIPYFYEIERLETGDPERLQAYIETYNDEIVTGLCIPHSILTKGDRIGTGVTAIGVDRIEKRIKTIQKRFASMFRRKVLTKALKNERFNTNKIPKIKFRLASPDAMTKKMDRISDLVRSGALIPDDNLEKWIRDMEELPESSLSAEEKDTVRRETLSKTDTYDKNVENINDKIDEIINNNE